MWMTIAFKALGGVAMAGLLWWGYDTVRDHFIEQENLRTQVSNLTLELEREKMSRESMQMLQAVQEMHNMEMTGLRKESTDRINEARTETQKHKDVLADRERLARVSKAKPGLLSKLGNRATEKRFESLEAIYN